MIEQTTAPAHHPTIRQTDTDALAFEDVSLTYPGGEVGLQRITFTVRAGEAVALCGANGSGKTTLLKLAAGLLSATTGTIRLAGDALTAQTRKTAFRAIGFLFQDSEDQLFCPTVSEDIAYGPVNLGLHAAEVAERVTQALEVMKITRLARRPIHHLSGGEKKRVALAGLLAMHTQILVLDEPTSGLDPAGANDLIATLRMLNLEYGHTLVVATHEIDRIPEFASRAIILKDGAIARDGQTADVFTDIPALQAVGLEAPIITRYFYWRNQQRGEAGMIPLTLAEALKMYITEG